MSQSLILKRAPIGWNQHDFDVVEDGVIVGRILLIGYRTYSIVSLW